MKKAILMMLMCAAPAMADIAVTQGSGKTVATYTDNSREFQDVVVTTLNVIQNGGGQGPVGWAVSDSSMPVAPAPGATFPVTGTFFQAVQPVSGNISVTSLGGNATFYVVNPASNTVNQGTPGTAAWVATLATGTVYNTAIDTDNVRGLMPSAGYSPFVLNNSTGLVVSIIPTTGTFSYVASTNNFASASNATDIAAICGGSIKDVAVTKVMVSCTQTTAGITPISVLKELTVYTGLYSTMTVVPDDSNFIGSVSTAAFFTANPTMGTVAGHEADYDLGCMATGTATPNDVFIQNWTLRPKILHGKNQCLTVNLEGATVTGGKFTVQFEWTEY